MASCPRYVERLRSRNVASCGTGERVGLRNHPVRRHRPPTNACRMRARSRFPGRVDGHQNRWPNRTRHRTLSRNREQHVGSGYGIRRTPAAAGCRNRRERKAGGVIVASNDLSDPNVATGNLNQESVLPAAGLLAASIVLKDLPGCSRRHPCNILGCRPDRPIRRAPVSCVAHPARQLITNNSVRHLRNLIMNPLSIAMRIHVLATCLARSAASPDAGCDRSFGPDRLRPNRSRGNS